jgi:hypothetical protein
LVDIVLGEFVGIVSPLFDVHVLPFAGLEVEFAFHVLSF